MSIRGRSVWDNVDQYKMSQCGYRGSVQGGSVWVSWVSTRWVSVRYKVGLCAITWVNTVFFFFFGGDNEGQYRVGHCGVTWVKMRQCG